MRICAISFPELRIELVRAEASARRATDEDEYARVFGPLAVVVAPPPLTEAKLLGNSRLDVVSREAARHNIARGQTIAQARAKAPALAVRVVRPDAVRDLLARLAEIGLAFGATVAFGLEGDVAGGYTGAFGDIVWVDVTGCAHLHGDEATLASRLAAVYESLGHACAVAIADGPRVAAMLARVAAVSAARSRSLATPVYVVPPGENAAAVASLPITALPLPESDTRFLAKLGVRTIGEVRALPRAGLAARLTHDSRRGASRGGSGSARSRASASASKNESKSIGDVLALIDGDDRVPLNPYVPPEIPVEETALEYGVTATEALTFVAKTLCDRLGARLAGRAVAAARIELELLLDAAMLRDDAPPSSALADAPRDSARGPSSAPSPRSWRSSSSSSSASLDGRREVIALALPSPLSAAGDLLAALRPKLDRLVLRAPVLGAKLRAAELVHKREAALSLFEPQPKAERVLPRLVAELVSDLGPSAVGTLVVGDSWAPGDRSKLVGMDPAQQKAARPDPKRKRRHLLSSVPEPSRLLAEPLPVAREKVRVVRHLTRLEAIEWWKRLPERASGTDGGERRGARGTDYVYGWTADGAAWVEIDRATGAMRVRGWFD